MRRADKIIRRQEKQQGKAAKENTSTKIINKFTAYLKIQESVLHCNGGQEKQ